MNYKLGIELIVVYVIYCIFEWFNCGGFENDN